MSAASKYRLSYRPLHIEPPCSSARDVARRLRVWQEAVHALAAAGMARDAAPFTHAVDAVRRYRESARAYGLAPIEALRVRGQWVRGGGSLYSAGYAYATAAEALAAGRRSFGDQRRAARAVGVQQRTLYGRRGSAVYSCRGNHDVGYVASEPGQFARLATLRRSRRIFDHKTPTDDRRWAAVEIEMISPLNQQALAAVLVRDVPHATRYLTLKSDTSIQTTEARPHSHELVVCAPLDEMRATLAAVCEALRSGDCAVNRSCGLHVHLDMRGMTSTQVRDCYTRLVRGQRLLLQLVPPSRTDNRFCKIVKTSRLPARLSAVRDRYRAINALAYSRHRTLEVRIFGGSVEFAKVWGAVQVSTSLAYCEAPIKRAPKTLQGWARALGWQPELTAWVTTRAAALARLGEAA